jgi:hypothetical protein
MMFEDNVVFGSSLSQSWLGADDSPSYKPNIILTTLSSGNCGDGSFRLLSVANSEVGSFETHQWYEINQCMIQNSIGARY